MGVADRVRFLGVVPHERMASVYSAADLLVLASEREGWPNVLLEAMACGARVVTTRVSDVAEVVNVPVAGAWIAERSAGCLEQAIRQVLAVRSEEQTSELQSLMRISYAVFCLKKKKQSERIRHEVQQQK